MSFYDESRRHKTYREDRYRDCRVLKDKETSETLLETRDIKKIYNRSSDKYHQVTSAEEGRLDLIAHKYYNNALLWWVIAEANELFDPITQVTAGSTLRIPSLDSLYGYKGILL